MTSEQDIRDRIEGLITRRAVILRELVGCGAPAGLADERRTIDAKLSDAWDALRTARVVAESGSEYATYERYRENARRLSYMRLAAA